MLSFAEEIYLLALDDISGKITTYSEEYSLGYALVAAIICELSFLNRIDTDLNYLYILDKRDTDNEVLDSILNVLSKSDTDKSISYWLKTLLPNAEDTENLILNQLIKKGILKRVDERIFWVFHTRRYPIINNEEIKNVEVRLRELIFDEDMIHTPRDAALVSLVQACDLFKVILSKREQQRSETRINNLAKLDTVGRAVVNMIKKISTTGTKY
ncbi:MAG TPA: GPP34 family phosphoprotein [Victivallales bacterium]|nr:GPP34 family phosphoprotein [Victivallales bacterium]